MSVLDTKFVQGFIRMCNDGWEQGWHERNGGNLSYRIKDEEVAEVKEFLHYDNEWKPIATKVPGLASEYFLVTGSGKYFRNVIIDPEDSICIIELDEKGENYRILWGLVNGGRPTSELPSHLMNHEVKKIATRDSYGDALVELGKEHDNLVVLDADLAAATKTGKFKAAFPERFIDCGIAECNMVGIAAGMSTCGKVPFASTFAMFAAGRAFDQLRNTVGYPHLNVKIGATHAGISVGEDGATHQCNEDIALMRTIPGMTIINPCDDIEAKQAVKAAYEMEGPVYLRFGRLATPIINSEDYKFEIGKGVKLKEGTDVTIVATGLMVAASLEAAKNLEADGINAEVINIHTIKPLDEDIIVESAKKTGKVITVEEHSIIGGLGSAVCDCLSAKYPVSVSKIGVEDVYGHSGPAVELLKEFGLDAEGIYNKIKKIMA